MKNLEDKILSVIDKHRMLDDGDTVIVAVSGGADSMCLLHFFNKFSSKMQLNIICAHVNHSIRGAEADSDEDFVRKFCAVNNINAVFANYDVPRIAKENGEEIKGVPAKDVFASLGWIDEREPFEKDFDNFATCATKNNTVKVVGVKQLDKEDVLNILKLAK